MEEGERRLTPAEPGKRQIRSSIAVDAGVIDAGFLCPERKDYRPEAGTPSRSRFWPTDDRMSV
jgi:hypothetical protein